MPISVQKQISAQLAFIADQLLQWAQTYGGVCQVVHTIEDLWMQSSQASNKPIIYVFCSGEEPWGDANVNAVTHRVNRDWILRVKKGRGFKAIRGDTMLEFTDAVEHVRDMMRAMLGISEDFGNDYQGWRQVKQGTTPLDCADIFFGTKNDLPAILMTPDDSPTP